MVTVTVKAGEFIVRLSSAVRAMADRKRNRFKELVATVFRGAVNSAPVGGRVGTARESTQSVAGKAQRSGLYRPPGGSLRRSASIQYVEDSPRKIRARVAFDVPYALLQHENTSGVTIKPSGGKYLFLPKTRRGYMASLTRNWDGVKIFRDYILPGFPGRPKSVRLKPQPRAKFLSKHIEAARKLLVRWLS